MLIGSYIDVKSSLEGHWSWKDIGDFGVLSLFAPGNLVEGVGFWDNEKVIISGKGDSELLFFVDVGHMEISLPLNDITAVTLESFASDLYQGAIASV